MHAHETIWRYQRYLISNALLGRCMHVRLVWFNAQALGYVGVNATLLHFTGEAKPPLLDAVTKLAFAGVLEGMQCDAMRPRLASVHCCDAVCEPTYPAM